jgi:xanthine dehydrogenase YagS FAD-binding subunit
MINFIVVPAGPWTRRSHYLKIRDRQSYQFALASAAVALDLDGDSVREARIALGGVATIPWRAHDAEAAMRGKRLDETVATSAADAAFANAHARGHNEVKLPLGRQTLIRALLETRDMKV